MGEVSNVSETDGGTVSNVSETDGGTVPNVVESVRCGGVDFERKSNVALLEAILGILVCDTL